jgi:beta-lactamase class D
MIYLNINNWRKPIFRFIKTKSKNSLVKFTDLTEVIKDSVKVVYEIVNNDISKIETRTINSSNEYINYIINKLGNHINDITLFNKS